MQIVGLLTFSGACLLIGLVMARLNVPMDRWEFWALIGTVMLVRVTSLLSGESDDR